MTSFSRTVVLVVSAILMTTTLAFGQQEPVVPGGELQILGDDGAIVGACPLKHTDVEADIVGFVGRVTVKQTFYNPTDQKIEAIYIFPLPEDAAVDDMVMQVGERRVIGQIKERDEAREIYEAAKAAGHVASLLDQERPNIFTQSVANIEPGVEVVIEISYVETLKYEDGVFEWVFPMVVGPRYIPGGGSAPGPMTRGRPTDQVPDADRITPPVTPEGTRAGHDISLTVTIDAGVGLTIEDVKSALHEITWNSRRPGQSPGATLRSPSQCTVVLKNQAEIPNKDFILHYRLAADEIGDAYLVHADERGKFFTLILQPPRRVVPEQLVPRELIFVLDTSGSMKGFPIEKAKQVMTKLVGTMRRADTFNIITFARDTRILWDAPRPATDENVGEAQRFLASRRGGGGTEMMKAINAALETEARVRLETLSTLPADGQEVTVWGRYPAFGAGERPAYDYEHMSGCSDDVRIRVVPTPSMKSHSPTRSDGPWIVKGSWKEVGGQKAFHVSEAQRTHFTAWPDLCPRRVRVVCFMTDGYVGNDMAIIDAVKKNADTTRVFSFGIGNSVNRFLLDGMAHAGRGEVEYVTLASQADAAVERFHERILAPVLTDIEIDWGTLPVADVYPRQIPDLFSAKPIMIHGRLTGEPDGIVTLRGNTGAGPYEDRIAVSWPSGVPDRPALASLWARAKVDHLMMQDYGAMQRGEFPDELKAQVTALGLEYRLMTQFTSFVAVEEMTVTVGGEPVTITVPVEMPDGVSYEGVFGDARANTIMLGGGRRMSAKRASGGAIAGGRGGGMFGQGAVATSPPPQATGMAGRPKASREMDRKPDLLAGDAELEAVSPEDAARMKLAEPLRDLAEKVEKEGKDGKLTVGKLTVTNYRVDVMIFLRDTSRKTLAALKELGFKQTGESKAVTLLIGTLDVRKLEALAKLDAVIRVSPVVEP